MEKQSAISINREMKINALKSLHANNLTTAEIAEAMDLSWFTVQKYCRELGLTAATSRRREIINRNNAAEEYIKQGLDRKSIQKNLNISPQMFLRTLRMLLESDKITREQADTYTTQITSQPLNTALKVKKSAEITQANPEHDIKTSEEEQQLWKKALHSQHLAKTLIKQRARA